VGGHGEGVSMGQFVTGDKEVGNSEDTSLSQGVSVPNKVEGKGRVVSRGHGATWTRPHPPFSSTEPPQPVTHVWQVGDEQGCRQLQQNPDCEVAPPHAGDMAHRC
jgi:hypothetical protein